MTGTPDYSDHCMIALYPPPEAARNLAVPGGLDPADLHVTVAYLGPADAIDAGRLNTLTAALATRPPITATLAGHARFTGGDKDVCVALVDSPALEDLHRDVTDALTAAAITFPRDHGYTAHTTLTYLDPDQAAPLDRLPATDVTFTALSVVHGTTRTDHPLHDPSPAEAARHAYATGWASSGGPLTDRVREGCRTAVALATEHPHDQHLLEVTVDLGRLEGTWALLFHRRDTHLRQHTTQVDDAWADLFTPEALQRLVADLRRNTLGILEADAAHDRTTDTLTLASATSTAILQAIGTFTQWDQLRRALLAALRAGRAEGIVNAVALAAERARHRGLDWDTAYTHTHAAVTADLDDSWADTTTWTSRLIGRAATRLARTLAALAAAGASFADMLTAATAILGRGSPDVPFVTDWAMTTAAAGGARALYTASAAGQIDVVTVGDGHVCATPCQDAEANGPWFPEQLPHLPLHPACRCTYAADLYLTPYEPWFADHTSPPGEPR
ncbi:hypothetical protein KCMC57_63880 (plasmid) [Kitasatospora sp. CMC57]|uniref:Uncharacterized protein n=1 Tax=Kitasatospora sp. CMC57 TaxID=3231513 RepID=A0AB33KEY6_9ACTN